jgi:hypothetical protein
MNINLTDAIQNIIGTIPEGCVFDSHLVIAMLQKEYPAVYTQYVDQFDEANLCSAHGLIAQQIHNANCVRAEVVGIQRQSYSINVHDRPNLCACWLRR